MVHLLSGCFVLPVPNLRAVLEARLRGVTQASKRKRLYKVLRKLQPAGAPRPA